MMNPSRLSLGPRGALLPFICAPGSRQMTIDRELLDRGDGQFYLRFYDWSPPALSVGYHQRLYSCQWTDLCGSLGFDLVRRPSGGQAVLHHQTLTYALVCPQFLPQLDRLQTYQYLCGFLIQGLAGLGIDLEWGQQKNYQQHPNCFAKASPSDLVTAGGEKLIGSAQVYAHGHILQHGTIVIHKDKELLQQFFGKDGSKIGSIDSFPQFQGQSLAGIQERLMTQLVQSASDYFGVSFQPRLAG